MVRFSVLINGSLYDFFDISTRDPLSPLLFVVVMEGLPPWIGGFHQVSKDNDVLLLSHFLFVGGTSIFCEANLDHLRNLGRLFLYFEVVS